MSWEGQLNQRIGPTWLTFMCVRVHVFGRFSRIFLMSATDAGGITRSLPSKYCICFWKNGDCGIEEDDEDEEEDDAEADAAGYGAFVFCVGGFGVADL